MQHEEFCPPEIASLASLTDGREPGDFESRYPASAWLQIAGELGYLIIVLAASFFSLVLLAKYVVLEQTEGLISDLLGDMPKGEPLVTWAAMTLAGVCGGCSSSLKWLYHGVAKKRWHRDRVIWRLVVPVLSGVLAPFVGLMVYSGLIPFLNGSPISTPVAGAAFGFFVGFFSDNVLASLQKVAYRLFGTVDKKSPTDNTKDGDPES